MKLGKIAITEGAHAALAKAGISPESLLTRHRHGDHGEVNPYSMGLVYEDLVGKETSIYLLSTGDAIWVTTDSEPITTVLVVPDHMVADLREHGDS